MFIDISSSFFVSFIYCIVLKIILLLSASSVSAQFVCACRSIPSFFVDFNLILAPGLFPSKIGFHRKIIITVVIWHKYFFIVLLPLSAFGGL